ncbi:hypothetical protein [Brevundimonas nasdae]|uniref:Uncharacterized protein n=1 Tax=Brevundimonas nasdae TaxID=172043 RepID=A0ACD4VK70_9CAUL|nr:hypothetical protein [Brevundimonas nasdae]WOB78426.1 hypothetical protein PZA08_14125 [Brevundimonas nasdae]
MRLRTIQIVAGLAAAVAFVLAFMVAGAALISGVFMLAGLAAVGWLAYSLIKGVLRRDHKPEPPARA